MTQFASFRLPILILTYCSACVTSRSVVSINLTAAEDTLNCIKFNDAVSRLHADAELTYKTIRKAGGIAESDLTNVTETYYATLTRLETEYGNYTACKTYALFTWLQPGVLQANEKAFGTLHFEVSTENASPRNLFRMSGSSA